MITIGGQTFSLDDPLVLAALAVAALVLILFVLLIATMRAAGLSARMAEPTLYQIARLGPRLPSFSDVPQPTDIRGSLAIRFGRSRSVPGNPTSCMVSDRTPYSTAHRMEG